MSSKLERFKDLHAARNLFLLPNAWNAKSARLFQEKDFHAIATSSAAVAESMGFRDGQEMSFQAYLFVIRNMLAAIEVPLTVDIEMGYGSTPEEIYSNIRQLIHLGVVGINIEDSIIGKTGRVLNDRTAFASMLEDVSSRLRTEGLELFINVRCDCYLLNMKNKQEEALLRIKAYEAAGADGIFLPCISEETDIAEAVAHTRLPVNVMCIPGLPDFGRLRELGVRRVSMGAFFFNKVYAGIGQLAQEIVLENSFAPLFS